MSKVQVIRGNGGVDPQLVDVDEIRVPDIWHTMQRLRDWPSVVSEEEVDEILETWHLCHDLKKHVLNQK